MLISFHQICSGCFFLSPTALPKITATLDAYAPSKDVQPAAQGPPEARGLHAAQDGCECSRTQNHKFT